MRGTIVVLCVLMLSTAAEAQPVESVSQADWRTFLEKTYARYRAGDAPHMVRRADETRSPETFEDRLLALGRGASASETTLRFARELNVDEAAARSYVALIVEAVRRRDQCSQDASCAFEPGVRIYDLAASVGMQEPTGGLLTVVGMNLTHGADTSFIRLTSEHPAAGAIFWRVFYHNEDAPYVMALLAERPVSEESAHLITGTTPTPGFGPDYWSGWYDAELEAAERTLTDASPLVRAALAQTALNRKSEIGAADEALQTYLNYPAEVRALLPVAPTCAACGDRRGEMSRANAQQLADHLIAALWAAGRQAEALALLHRGVDAFGARDANADARYRALAEALEPRLTADELFQRFIVDADCTQRTRSQSLNIDQGGWLFEADRMRGPLRDLIAARVRAAGFEDMAAYLFERDYDPREYGPDTLSSLAFLFNAEPRRQLYWQARIARTHAASAEREPTGSLHIVTAPVEQWWAESRLPDGVAPGRDRPAATPPSGLDLPMPAEAIMRFERRGGEYAAVYQSSQYDLPGEVPTYGLWFAHTVRSVWQRPVYLGLQSYFPYVPTAGSSVLLLDGDTLRMEVQVREIDQRSISFPPIGLSLSRSEDGVVLEFSLDRLRRDSDADGLPDLEERRIGLVADNPDSDGDGLNDGADPLPLTRFDANAPASRRLLAEAIITQIVGHEAGARITAPLGTGEQLSLNEEISRALGEGQSRPPAATPTIFLGADPDLFSGVRSRARLIIYSERDLAVLAQDGAPFYPPRISNIFTSPDGRTHYVIWTAGWTGGRFVVRCTDTACQTQGVSSWVT